MRACLHFGARWGRGQEGAVKNTGGRKGMRVWLVEYECGGWGSGAGGRGGRCLLFLNDAMF